MVPKSQQYIMGALNTYLQFFFKRSKNYSGEGGLSEKVHFGNNMVTKLLLLTHR